MSTTSSSSDLFDKYDVVPGQGKEHSGASSIVLDFYKRGSIDGKRYCVKIFLNAVTKDLLLQREKFIRAGCQVPEKILTRLEHQAQYRLRCHTEEVKILSLLHPYGLHIDNVVKIYETDLLYRQKYPTIIMEKLAGDELFDKINNMMKAKVVYGERNASKLLFNLATALMQLHKNNILHRDIKPDNIVYRSSDNSDDQAVLIDFGLSSIADTAPNGNNRGLIDNTKASIAGSSLYYQGSGLRGTKGYMAPEIYSHHLFSDKTDIWALGITMYIVLSASMPFNPRDEDLEQKTRNGNYAIPLTHKFFEKRSKDCIDLLASMIHLNPAHRPTAEQILQHPFITNYLTVPNVDFGQQYAKRINLMRGMSKMKKVVNGIKLTTRLRKCCLQSQQSIAKSLELTVTVINQLKEAFKKHHMGERKGSESAVSSEGVSSRQYKEVDGSSTSYDGHIDNVVLEVLHQADNDRSSGHLPQELLDELVRNGVNYNQFCEVLSGVGMSSLANKRVFDAFDKTHKGLICSTDFLKTLTTMRTQAHNAHTGDSDDHDEFLQLLFDIFDEDFKGSLKKHQLYHLLGYLLHDIDRRQADGAEKGVAASNNGDDSVADGSVDDSRGRSGSLSILSKNTIDNIQELSRSDANQARTMGHSHTDGNHSLEAHEDIITHALMKGKKHGREKGMNTLSSEKELSVRDDKEMQKREKKRGKVSAEISVDKAVDYHIQSVHHDDPLHDSHVNVSVALFDAIDLDHDGSITFKEFKRWFEACEARGLFPHNALSLEQDLHKAHALLHHGIEMLSPR